MTGVRVDPFGGFNFFVTLVDSLGEGQARNVAGTAGNVLADAVGGFSEASGLEGTLTVEEYNEGGENRFVHKFPTRMTWSNIVLRRGLGVDRRLINWHTDYVNGRGRRRDGIIALTSDLKLPVKIWKFRRGFPLKWTGPTLNAQQSAVAIESIEIAHEGLEIVL